jgi:hypothetical protein
MSSASMIWERDVELLAGGGREPQAGDPLAALEREQVAALREPVVVEHRVHPLLPLRSLVREQMTGPDPGAEIQDVRRGDP